MDEYWKILHRNGIDKKRLLSFERGIHNEPSYQPNMIGDFEHYLFILKQLHSSDDLGMLIDECRHWVDGETNGMFNDVLGNFKDSDTLRQMDRITKLRQHLHKSHFEVSNLDKLKDVIFVDIILEQ